MVNSDITTMMQHIFRRLFEGHPKAPTVDMSGKTVVVTGAAIGSVGYETAKTLARWGANVVITSRSSPRTIGYQIKSELQKEGVQPRLSGHPLDLSSAESVEKFVKWYKAVHGNELDVLVNNAGIHLDLLSEWKDPKLTRDGFEIHWRTNYLGTYHLTYQLLPFLQNAGSSKEEARVVNVVSHLHTKGKNRDFFEEPTTYESWLAYANSKLALVHHAFEIDRRFGDSGVFGFAAHPGAVYSNIAEKGLQGHPVLQRLRRLFSFVEKRLLLTPEMGAQTQIRCASDPKCKTGYYYERCEVENPSKSAQDRAVSQKLWDQTEAWVKTLAPETVRKTVSPS